MNALEQLIRAPEVRGGRRRQSTRLDADAIATALAGLGPASRALEAILDVLPDGVVLVDATGRVVFFNRAADEIAGVGDATRPRDLWADLWQLYSLDAIDAQRFEDGPIDRVANGDEFTDYVQYVCHSKKPNGLWVSFTARTLRNDEGARVGGVLVARDVTREHAAEEALRASNERFRQLAENIEEVFWIMSGSNQKMIYVSAAYEQIWGRSLQSLYADESSWLGAVHPDDRATAEATRDASSDFDVTYRVLRPDGTLRFVRDRGFPVVDEEGNVFRIAGIAQDITELEDAKQKLEAHSKELARSNAELAQFASFASHDLREPLRVISAHLGFLEAEHGAILEGTAREYVSVAADGAKRLDEMIRDLLDYARVGSTPHRLEDIDCDVLVRSVARDLAFTFEETRATIELSALPNVVGDRTQLRRVFQNLIANAIKFRGNRAPVVTVGAHTDGDRVIFSIADNGIGIEPGDRERIFRLFERLHTRKDYDGTGIGLAVCKRIVEQHDGRIWVDSTPGSGSTFFVSLPRGTAGPTL